jgi:hypothetical protein
MNRREFVGRFAVTPVLGSQLASWLAASSAQSGEGVKGQPSPSHADKPDLRAPEKKSPTEVLDVQSKAERIWRGEEPVPARYPYILPDYKLEFPHIGTEPQLFLDNYMSEWLYDLERVMETPQKYPDPVLRGTDFEWEAYGGPIPVVLYDREDKTFKMWYCVSYGTSVSNMTQVLCYAESEDGIRWRKPLERGGLAFGKNRKTNIVLQGVAWHSVLKETHEPDPNKRYKFVFWDTQGNSKFGVAYSRDGYRAERTRVTPYILTHNTGTFWDPALQKYVSYGQYGHHWNYLYRVRGVGRQESEDLLRWTPRQPVILPDGNFAPSFEPAAMEVHKVGSLYIGTVANYDMEPIWRLGNGPKGQRFNTREQVHPNRLLAYSRDGLRWSFAENGKVWLDNGPPGSPDHGFVDALSPPALHNGKLYFYISAANYNQGLQPANLERIIPKALRREELLLASGFALAFPQEKRRNFDSVTLATLRQEGYMRVQPRYNEGSLLTRQFVFEGDRLYLNSISEFGWAQVEVLDDEMEPLPGFRREECDRIRGDSVAHEVRWKDNPDVRSLWNRPIRLKVYLTDCWLYSFRFGYAGEQQSL